MNRRQFVALLSTMPLVGNAACALAAPSRADRLFPFGFSLYGAPGVEPHQALREVARIGYDCVELSCLPGSPTEPEQLSTAARRELREQLAGSGLTLAALMENLREPSDDAAHRTNLERLKRAGELGHLLSPERPPVVETILGGKPQEWDTLKRPMADRLAGWARMAEQHRTVIAIKPHVGNALHLPEDALWLLEQVKSPWLKLAYDYSHYQLRGLGLEQTIALLAPHSAFVHVKDAQGEAAKFQFLLPGESNLDYGRYFRLLHEAGYRGPVVVEVSSQISRREGYDWRTAAQQSYERLAPHLASR